MCCGVRKVIKCFIEALTLGKSSHLKCGAKKILEAGLICTCIVKFKTAQTELELVPGKYYNFSDFLTFLHINKC